MQQQGEIENQIADAFLASAPKLARPRALWQAG
jgi:hypothetical protein